MLGTHTRGQGPVVRGQAHATKHYATERASSKHASTAGHTARSRRTATKQGTAATTKTAHKKLSAIARRHTNGTVAPHRATVSSSSCSAEFGQCGGAAWTGPICCMPPHRCYKQSDWYSQCGSTCPEEASWACRSQPPSIGIIVARWGGWPSWMPLFLHTLRHNPTVDFHLLSDVPPPATAPLAPNVRYHAWSLDELLVRLRETVGVRLRRLHAGGVFASGVSSAKLNDFKPMFGEVFADMLSPYEWWGHLQEDLLLGQLRRFASPAVLGAHDVLCPYAPPLNASGVLMLYRNVARVNRAWRASSDADRVLSSPTYLVFDEWWGGLAGKDNLAAVLGRHAEAGVLRLGLARRRSLWFGDDKRYVNLPTPRFNDALAACWRRGQLWQGPGGGCAGALGARGFRESPARTAQLPVQQKRRPCGQDALREMVHAPVLVLCTPGALRGSPPPPQPGLAPVGPLLNPTAVKICVRHNCAERKFLTAAFKKRPARPATVFSPRAVRFAVRGFAAARRPRAERP